MLEHGQDEKFGLDPVAIWPWANQLPPALAMPVIHHDKSPFLETNLCSAAYLPVHKWPRSTNSISEGHLGFTQALGENSHRTPWCSHG